MSLDILVKSNYRLSPPFMSCIIIPERLKVGVSAAVMVIGRGRNSQVQIDALITL